MFRRPPRFDAVNEWAEILDTNKELCKELASEIATNNISNKKLNTLSKELDTCYKTISQQDSKIVAHEEEILFLKSEIKSLKQSLQKVQQDLKHKGNASTSQDIYILRLEDKINQLKNRIRELADKKLSLQEIQMAVPDLLANIGSALDQVENYIGGDITINPINTLNGI